MRSLPSELEFLKIIPLIDIEISPLISQVFELLVVQDEKSEASFPGNKAGLKGKTNRLIKKKTSLTIHRKYWAGNKKTPKKPTQYQQVITIHLICVGSVCHASINQTCLHYFKTQPSLIQAFSGLPSNPREEDLLLGIIPDYGPSTLGLLVPNLFRIRTAQLGLSSHWHHTYAELESQWEQGIKIVSPE